MLIVTATMLVASVAGTLAGLAQNEWWGLLHAPPAGMFLVSFVEGMAERLREKEGKR